MYNILDLFSTIIKKIKKTTIEQPDVKEEITQPVKEKQFTLTIILTDGAYYYFNSYTSLDYKGSGLKLFKKFIKWYYARPDSKDYLYYTEGDKKYTNIKRDTIFSFTIDHVIIPPGLNILKNYC